MMRVWPLVLESVMMVILWGGIVVMAMMTVLCFAFSNIVYPLAFTIGLGLLHFILNVWLVSLLRGSMNGCLLTFLALTQTTPLFLLCRRTWRSFVAGCEKNQVTKKHKALRAKYALCNNTSSSSMQLPEITEQHTYSSCVPPQSVPAAPPLSTADGETPAPGAAESGNSIAPLKVTPTKFLPNTKTIRLSFDDQEEIYAGEPKLYKYVAKSIQSLYAEEKRLSYHIIVDTSQALVHVSKSGICAEELPDRIVTKDPLTVCNDTHYIVNFVKGLGYQTIGVTKRAKDEVQSFTDGDLNKLVWLLVWPCTVLMIFSSIDYRDRFTIGEFYIAIVSPVLGVIVWLVTQRGIDDPWRNTLILIPLRLCFTVSRTIVVCAIGTTWLRIAVFAYISAKVVGLVSIATRITYAKVRKNIELYSDAMEKYTYNSMYEPVVQVAESVVYCCWAIWWHTYYLAPDYIKTGVLLMVIISQIAGLTWLWFMRAFLKEPLQDPVQVLQMVKDREFSRT
ncbi:uncharacterized protein LOC122256892 isoform X2 [Penaeus japonicus]|uniref:uncharacterized protein LOC122256892 isoform X2 n=1 Tax=Penaeus japonicus TaxID=27405 RepID=UPI001C7149E3|nr:uncharacterized protein LOC122256892 isoform X2 [Penaeus japonicus]